MKELRNIYQTAITASIEASIEIVKHYREGFTVNIKDDDSPVTSADLASSEIIYGHLLNTNIPIIGEEHEEEPYSIRSSWEECWSVDPLDGTKMFLQKNDEFSVNIAHVKKNKAVFGLISNPVEKQVLIGGPDIGAYLFSFDEADNPAKWKEITDNGMLNGAMTICCSRGFRQDKFPFIRLLESEFPVINYLRKGSALKFIDLATGKADIYPRFAPTMEWDIAAGHAILNGMGGEIVSYENNESLIYNKESLFNPNFVARTKRVIS